MCIRDRAVPAHLFLELAGAPAAVAEGDEHLLRAGAARDRLEDVLAGRHLETAFDLQRRVVRAALGALGQRLVQDEAALGLDRAAEVDRHSARSSRSSESSTFSNRLFRVM